MSLLDALEQSSVLDAARALLAHKVSLVPVRGKQPAVRWQDYQQQRPLPGQLDYWQQKGLLAGIAVICGQVSGHLVIMDCDGDAAVERYEAQFPALLNTLTVQSGSGHGRHYYYYTQERTLTTRTKGFELRSDGCYVVAPPSRHPVSGRLYQVIRHNEALVLPSLSGVRAWIDALKTPHQRRKAVPVPAKMTGIERVKNPTAYAQVALRYECDHVRLAAPGQRNTTLSLAALKMGNLVGLGWISRTRVEDALLTAAAALNADEGEQASRLTITSGIDAGMKLEARS